MPLVSHAGEFTMSVKIDGQDATVYQEKHHQEGDGRTRSEGWICSEVGKGYTIGLNYETYRASISPQTKHKDISARLTIDGVRTQRAAIRHSANKQGRTFDGPLSHNNQRFPYMFQKPDLRAGDSDDEAESAVNTAIGTMALSLFRVKYRLEGQLQEPGDLGSLTAALSEKQKKGSLSSVTQYGPSVDDTPSPKYRRQSTQDKEGSPYCKMTIRYASREVLQAMDIIPRDPRLPTPPAELPASTPTPPPETIDAKPLISRSSSPQVDVEATATLDRSRRAREELELKEKAWKQAREEMEEAERSLRAGTSANASIKRKRGDEDEEKSVLRRKLQGEMTEALRGYDGTAIDLTLDNMDEAGTAKLSGETIDLTGYDLRDCKPRYLDEYEQCEERAMLFALREAVHPLRE